jgi:hypothetical protein
MATTHPTNITVPIMAFPPPEPSTPPYDESFENAIMERAISTAAPPHGQSQTPTAIPILPAERPLPLSDSRRQHPLPSTSLLLTEQGGSIYGGAGSSKEKLRAEAQDLIDANDFTSKDELEELIGKKVEDTKQEARARAYRRLEALKKNARIDEEIRELEMNHQMEKRAMEKRTKG